MPGQMVLSLQSGIADVANEPTFNCVLDDVLLHQVSFRQRHLALRAAIKDGAIQSGFLADLTGLEKLFS